MTLMDCRIRLIGRCLVKPPLPECAVKRLMRALRVIIASEPPELAASAGWTAAPRRIEAVRLLFEHLPPLDVVVAAVLHVTTQSQSGQNGPISEAIDQQFHFREVMMLSESS